MSVSVGQLRKLQEVSGVSIRMCKDALDYANGDMEIALDYIKSKICAVKIPGTEEERVAWYIHNK